MNAHVMVRDGAFSIRNLSGQINASIFSINGAYSGGKDPVANLTVASPNLDLDDVVLLAGTGGKQGNGGNGQAVPKMDLKLTLTAEMMNYRKLPLTKVNASLTQDKGVLTLQGFDAGLLGGYVTAKGTMDRTGVNGNGYDLGFNLERVNAERLFQALDVSREVTGTLNLNGNLAARGNSMTEVKKTASGSVRLRFEEGKLRKFNVLSKVFSILNISQLLKFQLPDMVSGGMPYNEIKGTLSLKDGIVSCQDLLIKGDAINMSMVGTADIVKEELNVTIGVQPLQTVDKIVSRIPVVGWLLTGKNKALLTAYFEAKGTWSDPQVTAIPVKSIAKGVFNIFRRVFELPVRLFTDTGEVILGK